jgi:peptidoglycan pentaglycine glycine transferase (the first glycine)
MPSCTLPEWEDFLNKAPDAHLLQSPAWGELKSGYGWDPVRIVTGDLGTQVLFQKLPLGFQVAYIPRGPVSLSGNNTQDLRWEKFQTELDQICQERKAVFLKIEPDSWQGEGQSPPAGYRLSPSSIQPPRTILIDLQDSEDQILGRMKPKTRYNIRLAAKNGVTVRELEDVELFYNLLENTSDRAEFGIHTLEYYRDAFRLFHQGEGCKLFLAEFEGVPLASIMVFRRGKRSWYFYGASSDQHRDKMATYLVQWEAMRWAKEQGCASYDLWGVPDQDLDTLEEDFTKRTNGLWGVYRFKRGFGGDLIRSAGPWDRVYQPLLYNLYLLRSWMSAE